VLDDFQDPSSNGATSLQLDLPASYSSGEEVALTASGLSATSGITLGGQTVQSDGDLSAPAETPISVDGDTVTVSIPAGSAELLTFGSSSGSGESTTFVGQLSGKCLSVSAGSTANGAAADIYDCNGSPSENWTVESNGTIVGGLSGECLEVAGNSTANYAGVDIGSCDGAASQRWTVEANNTIVGAQSGKCLSVTGASTADRALADIYTCNGSGSETWN
jgi:Ricin-type beta-trefoil lectin domain